ncbi:ankyrin repeat domain-containing protein [Luteibacter sp. NPDC031894]|uniref:ankyrin repeat domain-containing protein n=1 Tax=Luteibacter sp. NPDC031894 TaxID=3390572 RepID=UPI003D08762F
MAHSKRRRPPLIKALPWFLPALAAVACAGLTASPLALIPLLLANALAMGAVCHAIGFDPEPSYLRTVLRRGAAHVVMFTAYTFVVFVLVAWPLLKLTQAPSLGAALLLAATLVVALAALWRVWPAFGLVFVWDDAYPEQSGDGSWIFTAMARSISFGRHLSAEERFFSHFLPASLGLLVLAFSAVALSGLYGVLPAETRIAALGVYALVLLPLGCMVIANRTLRALLCDRRGHIRTARAEPRRETSTIADEPVRAPIPVLDSAESQPGVRERALLAAAREGDIARAVALVEAGAHPDTTADPGERDQRPVLTLAALSPDTRLLRALIGKGAQVNRAHNGITALLAASRDSWHGRPEAVLTLLTNGANAAGADGEGNTPLHGAVLSAEPTVAAMLLDAGAPVDAVNHAGETPLVIACRAANWTLARFLLDHGAKPAPVGSEPALVAAAGIPDDDCEGVKVLLRYKAPVNATDANGRTALLAAAAEGHEQIARVLLQAHANPNLADRNGTTALMEAARAGAHGIVQLLAEANADASPRDGHGRDALTLACQSPRAQAATVRALLTLGAQPKEPAADGRSALDHAAATGRWDFVALLDPETPLPTSLSESVVPEAGADSPMHLYDALRFGHWAVASTFAGKVQEWPAHELAALYVDLAGAGFDAARAWLLDHGLAADARLAPPAGDDGALGKRLFDALLPQLPQSADALLQLMRAGASPAGAGLLGHAICRLEDTDERLTLAMLEAGADPFGADARGRTPVHMAAATGRVALLAALLARGMDPNVRDAGGRTPLHAALEQGGDSLPLVRLLVAHGADPEAADVNGETPFGLGIGHGDVERWLSWSTWPLPRRALRPDDLPAAAASGDLHAVERLLELGFAVDARDHQGATGLLRAAGAGRRDVAERLLAAGADPTTTAASGVTPLAAAVTARRDTVVALLIEHGVAIDQRLPGDATALMIAATLGYPDVVDMLLAAGADAAAEDAHGHTALHAAAQFCFGGNDSLRARRLLDALIGKGVDVNKADKDGVTPLLILLGAHMRPGADADATHLGALVPVLLDAGAKLEHADHRGVSALHACAMHALLPPARVLLQRGASRNAADAFGRTAGDVARHLGYVDIAHELGVRVGAIPSVRQTLRQPAQPD